MYDDVQLEKSPAGQILKLLQQRGELRIKDIEAALGVTSTAVRQQLKAVLELVQDQRENPEVRLLGEKRDHSRFGPIPGQLRDDVGVQKTTQCFVILTRLRRNALHHHNPLSIL